MTRAIYKNKMNKIAFIIFCFIYLFSITAYANEAINPDYNRFKERVLIFCILITIMFVASKILAKYSKFFIKNKLIKVILNTDTAEYALRICISTTAFYIIGGGFLTSNYWADRELLIEIIIICIFIFLIDTLLIRPIKSINNYLKPNRTFFCYHHNNKSIYVGILILVFLLASYANLTPFRSI